MGGLWSILGFLHSLRRLCFLQKVSEAMSLMLLSIYTESTLNLYLDLKTLRLYS